jgi:hypothetical protein
MSSLAYQPQLDALSLEVEEIRNMLYGHGSLCWFGGRLVIKPEINHERAFVRQRSIMAQNTRSEQRIPQH